MKPEIYRIQDKAGRGPYRPGFSKFWLDPQRPAEERPDIFQLFDVFALLKATPQGAHIGTGFVDLKGLIWWFSSKELDQLERRGYFPVRLEVDGILGISERQILFYRILPLRVGWTRLILRG